MIGAWRSLGQLPREVWLICIGTLINKMGQMVVPFLALYLTSNIGLSATQAGTVIATFGLGAVVGSPFSGWLMRKAAPVAIMRTSFFLSAALMFIYPLARTFTETAVLAFLLALCNELFRPANLTALSSLVPDSQRKVAFSLHRLAVNLGMSIGPALGGVLAARSFTFLFVVDGITALLAGTWLLVFLRGRVVQPPPPQAASSVAAPLRDPNMRTLFVAVVLISSVFQQLDATVSLHLVDVVHLPIEAYGMLFTVNTLLIVMLEVPLNVATAHWQHGRTAALGALLVGIGTSGMGLVTGMPTAVVAMVILTVGEMVAFPTLSSLAAQIAPEHARAQYLALYSMTFGLALMTGPWLGVHVREWFGSAALWGGMFATSLVSFALLWRMRAPVQPS